MTALNDRPETLDIQAELNRLEELFIDSRHIFRWALVHEDDFLDQLDLVRENLPEAFRQAEALLRQRDDILAQAEEYAQKVVEDAERRATQLINDNVILRQAEYEAQQLRSQLQTECDAAQDKTIGEIEQMRQRAQQDLEGMRQMGLQEAEEIQRGADEYADSVLRDMEAQMADMLRIVRNGRQQLKINQPDPQAAYRNVSPNNGSAPRSPEGSSPTNSGGRPRGTRRAAPTERL
jgi:F0F1-type ATP synthase membrane subunit b/b'